MPSKIDFHPFFEKCILTFTTVFNRWENIARSTELIAGRVGNIIQNFRALNPTFCSCIVSQIRNMIWSAVYFCRWNICLPCYSKEEKEKNGGIWKSVSDQSCLLPLLFFSTARMYAFRCSTRSKFDSLNFS